VAFLHVFVLCLNYTIVTLRFKDNINHWFSNNKLGRCDLFIILYAFNTYDSISVYPNKGGLEADEI
ncbi:hypothetical protein, partial [Lactococcus cremoris]